MEMRDKLRGLVQGITGEKIDWDCNTKQKCTHCGHLQDYKGKLLYYTCSSCRRKSKVQTVMKGGKNGK